MTYRDENWRAFIINYLLIHFNVRNKDLDLIVVSSKRRGLSDIQICEWFYFRF